MSEMPHAAPAPADNTIKTAVLAARPIVVFDGVCNLCSHSAQFIIGHDRRHLFMFASAQSNAGRALLRDRGFDPENLDTFVLLKEGQVHVRSDAALEIAGRLDWPWRGLTVLRVIPRVIRDPVYNLIARNRYRWFGKKDHCMMPTPEIRARFVE